MKDIKIQQLIKEGKIVPADEVFADFTDEERHEVDMKLARLEVLYKLREERHRLGLSQEALAIISGIPRTTIVKIENGERNVTLEKLLTLASAMGKKLELNFV